MLEKVYNEQSKLTELYTEPEYDELKDVLQSYLNPEAVSETSTESKDSGDAPWDSKNEQKKESVAETTSNVEDAFDDLFNS